MKKLPCFILSRKESKGLKNKNTYKFLNKPLIQHTIDYAKRTKSVTDIVVSTDDPKSAEIANKNKCIVIYPRPKIYQMTMQVHFLLYIMLQNIFHNLSLILIIFVIFRLQSH